MDEEFFSIRKIFKTLEQHIALILICITLSTASSAVINFYVLKPKYQTTAKLFIGNEVSNLSNGEIYSPDVSTYQRLMETYEEIIYTEDLIKRSLDNSNISGVTATDVLKGLEVTTTDTTQILKLEYTTGNREEAKKVVDSIIKEFMITSKELIPIGSVQVVMEASEPIKPISPKKTINIALGVVIGAFLGIAISIIMEYMDNSIKTKEDVEKLLDVPVIGMVGEYNEKILKKESKRLRRVKKCST